MLTSRYWIGRQGIREGKLRSRGPTNKSLKQSKGKMRTYQGSQSSQIVNTVSYMHYIVCLMDIYVSHSRHPSSPLTKIRVEFDPVRDLESEHSKVQPCKKAQRDTKLHSKEQGVEYDEIKDCFDTPRQVPKDVCIIGLITSSINVFVSCIFNWLVNLSASRCSFSSFPCTWCGKEAAAGGVSPSKLYLLWNGSTQGKKYSKPGCKSS